MNITFKPQHEGTLPNQLIDLIKGRDYFNAEIAPNLHEVAKWEQKEYNAVQEERLAEINGVVETLRQESETFDKVLSVYGYTTGTFLTELGF